MKWILVYIFINPLVPGDVMSLEPVAINAAGSRVTYNDMYECFAARERLSKTVGIGNGYFGPGKQAICIPIESTDT
jgi:hypothetical protein